MKLDRNSQRGVIPVNTWLTLAKARLDEDQRSRLLSLESKTR